MAECGITSDGIACTHVSYGVDRGMLAPAGWGVLYPDRRGALTAGPARRSWGVGHEKSSQWHQRHRPNCSPAGLTRCAANAASSPLLTAETPGKGPQKESSQYKPGSDEHLHPPSLDSLKLPQSFNSYPFSLVICFDNITPRAHKFLAGERHSSTLRSCAALEPELSESREIRFFRRSLPAARVSTKQARVCPHG